MYEHACRPMPFLIVSWEAGWWHNKLAPYVQCIQAATCRKEFSKLSKHNCCGARYETLNSLGSHLLDFISWEQGHGLTSTVACCKLCASCTILLSSFYLQSNTHNQFRTVSPCWFLQVMPRGWDMPWVCGSCSTHACMCKHLQAWAVEGTAEFPCQHPLQDTQNLNGT